MRFINGLFAAAVALTASNAHASTAESGYISQITVLADGVILFRQSGTRTTPPGCQLASDPKRWSISTATAAGQAKAATLLTAYALRKQIVIYGSHLCSDWPDTETPTYFHTTDDG